MKKLIVVVLLGMIIGAFNLAFAAEKDSKQPSLAQFDEDVAVYRRVVREYCAIVQDMMKDAELNTEKQAEGLVLLRDAGDKWDAIQKRYAANPPADALHCRR